MKRSLTSWVQAYLAHRRALGYQLRAEGRLLLRLGRYADRRGERVLTRELAWRWARLPRLAARSYWARRLSIVRGLARYCAAFDPRHEVPPNQMFGPAHPRQAPHLYSTAQIQELLRRARRLSGALRPHTYATLLGLLACAGLRISEALRLDLHDVDLEHAVIHVRASKYHSSRLVPVHATTLQRLRAYARKRQRRFPQAQHFFVSQRGRALAYPTVQGLFLKLRAGLESGPKPPRLHDLRHTFACRVLLRSMRRTRAVAQDPVAVLSRYLGHNRVRDTYWYLTTNPDLLAQAAQKYAHHRRY